MADFDPGLHPGEILTNDDIRELFKCSQVGSIRYSQEVNCLVLISGEDAGPCQDRWREGKLCFTGTGLRGDQNLNERENRILAEAETNGVALFHFENPAKDRYVFTGRMRLAGAPFLERQRDEIDNDRQVWVFPLVTASESVAVMPATSG